MTSKSSETESSLDPEPQTLSILMSSAGGGGGPSSSASGSANVSDPSEIHLEEGIVQQQQQDSDLGLNGGGVNKIHPASYRPASLTVNTSSNSRNVSIIINPMEANASSGSAVGSNGSGNQVTQNGGSTNPSASASADRYQPSIEIVDDCGSPGTGTESPGTSQMSPPPSYHDIPGTVPVHQGVSRGPPPSYEDAVDPNGMSQNVEERKYT